LWISCYLAEKIRLSSICKEDECNIIYEKNLVETHTHTYLGTKMSRKKEKLAFVFRSELIYLLCHSLCPSAHCVCRWDTDAVIYSIVPFWLIIVCAHFFHPYLSWFSVACGVITSILTTLLGASRTPLASGFYSTLGFVCL
jgi:hypothetical protein